MSAPYALNYAAPGPVAAAFMADNSLVRGLRGPIGSGKSVACAVELFRRALQQQADAEGIRPTRWLVIRNTHPELMTTTVKTWLEWFPEHVFGPMRRSAPYTHHIKLPLPDGTKLDMEVIFIALDRPEDVKKLLSAEATGIWINEAREMHKSIVDAATSRIAGHRFPPSRRVRPTWHGMIMDTNAPPEDHWWPILAGDRPIPEWMTAEDAVSLIKPPDWKFFSQPPALRRQLDAAGNLVGYEINPEAENVQAVTPDYYLKGAQGKDRAWIAVYMLNEYGEIRDGQPVYDGWRRETHIAQGKLEARDGVMLEVGLDFGLTPAAAICQRWGDRIVALDELIGTNIGAARFAKRLKRYLSEHFPAHYPEKIRLWGDPAGEQRAQTDERTPANIYRAEGFLIRKAPSNDILLRIEAVNRFLGALSDGEPALLISPACKTLIGGFDGGYHYKKKQGGFDAGLVSDKPDKNTFSHIHDAFQYACLGVGAGREVLGQTSMAQPVVAPREGSPFSRSRQRQGPVGLTLPRRPSFVRRPG